MDKQKQKDSQREYYNKGAKNYDFVDGFNRNNKNHNKKLSYIIQKAEFKNGDKVLEVGIGTGLHAQSLLSKIEGLNFYGIDISDEMIEICKERIGDISNVSLYSGDYSKVEFETKFDVIYMCATLHHLPNPVESIRELYSMLNIRGKLILVEPNYYFIKNYWQMKTIPEEKNQSYIKEHIIENAYLDAGFSNFSYEYFSYTPPFPSALIPFYELTDKVLGSVPILKKLSIVVGAYGEKMVS